MNDQKSQPGQRNIASHGDRNINASGDNPTFNLYNTPPERSPKHQLRAPVGDFVGRETEIAELTAELTNGGQVGISGISGMGGIGKTELAMVVANRLLPNYPDAQLLVELRGTSEHPRKPEDALADCVRAFVGLEARLPDDLPTLVKWYRDRLTGQRVLVVLDNAADADQIRPFLVPPGCALLVTSRDTINLPGLSQKNRIRLHQLPPDKARDLLRKIAPRVTESVADQICYLCGYLPLAVRAAASLLDVTPDLEPAEYAAELSDERRRLEAIGTEGVEISVTASFNLSYARLSEETKRVFRGSSVFPASFDAAAEEAVCQDAGHKLLSALLRRNLVIFDETERRYRLHDLARVFANAQLNEDEREDLKLNHAQHFCDVLAEAGSLYLKGGEQVVQGTALFDSERTNIETGQAWAAIQRDAVPDAAELCLEYVRTLGVNILLELRQHPRRRIRWLEIQLATARRLKRQESEGNALGNLGLAYADLGETRKAIEFYEQQLVIAREIGDRRGEGNALGNLGSAYADLGETRKAKEFYEQILVIHREIGDRRGEGADLGNLGLAYYHLGETRKAIEFYEQQLVIIREIGDRRGKGNALGNLGLAYADLGETRKAIEFYQQALVIAREIGDRRGEGNALGNLGSAYADLGEKRKAIEFYEQALVIDREIGDRRGESTDLWNLALALDTLGEREAAIANAEAALKIREAIEDPRAAKVREQLAEWQSGMMKDE